MGNEAPGYKIFRFVILKRAVEDTINEARKVLKVTVRDFKYDVEEIQKKEENRAKVAEKSTSDVDDLRKACVESFKDIYSAYVHLKFLKVVIDSQMRFGSSDDYILLLVKVGKGKEKRIHKGVIEVLADKSKKGRIL